MSLYENELEKSKKLDEVLEAIKNNSYYNKTKEIEEVKKETIKPFLNYAYNNIKKKINCSLYICIESVGRYVITITLFYLLYFIVNFFTCTTWLQVFIRTIVYGTFLVVASFIVSEIIIKIVSSIKHYYKKTLKKIEREEQVNKILKDLNDKKEKFLDLFPELKNDAEYINTLFECDTMSFYNHIKNSNYKNKKAMLKEFKTFFNYGGKQ